MSAELEHRAWHIAGHAWMAMTCEFPVIQLSLNELSEADLAQHPDAQRLDEWTMIKVPDCHGSVGSFEHTNLHEQLMYIALAGPVRELMHRGLRSTVENVQRFTHDWKQAWTSAGFLRKQESARLEWLRRMIHNSPTVLTGSPCAEFASPVVRHLLAQGTMNAADVAKVWEEMHAKVDEERDRPQRRRRRRFEEEDDEEMQNVELDDFEVV